MVRKTLKSSKAYTVDSAYSNPDFSEDSGVPQKTNLMKYKDLMQDPIVISAYNKWASLIMGRGYKILYLSKDEEYERATKLLLKKIRFDQYLSQLIRNTEFYKYSFTEIRKKKVMVGNVVTTIPDELFVLETPSIKIQMDKKGHGDIIGFVQELNGKKVKFSPDEIAYLKAMPFDSSIYGLTNVKSLQELVNKRLILEDYLHMLFSTNKFADYWIFEDTVPQERIAQLLSDYKRHRLNPNSEFLITGKGKYVLHTDFKFVQDILALIEYYKNQTYALIGLPSEFFGDNQNDGRSKLDVMSNTVVFEEVIDKQRMYEDFINNELFPKMGIQARIKFNTPFRVPTKELIENALKLKALNLTNDVIAHYLTHQDIPIDLEFVSEEPSKNSKDAITNQTSESRQPISPDDKTYNMNDQATTRRDQIEG